MSGTGVILGREWSGGSQLAVIDWPGLLHDPWLWGLLAAGLLGFIATFLLTAEKKD